MGVHYYVNPSQFAQHPIYESIIKENPHLGFSSSHEPGTAAYRRDLTNFIRLPPQVTPDGTSVPVKIPSKLAKFERTVERSYIHQLQQICRQEVRHSRLCRSSSAVPDRSPKRLSSQIQIRHDRLDRARGFLGQCLGSREIVELTDGS